MVCLDISDFMVVEPELFWKEDDGYNDLFQIFETTGIAAAFR
jgi:hypothetical protein